MWAEISWWAGAARKETARGAALGTRWGWPAIALSASAPNATRTGTATSVVATTAALASASAKVRAATGDEQMAACHTLQRKSHLCIQFLGIARPRSQFPHSWVCERFMYSQGSVHILPAAE